MLSRTWLVIKRRTADEPHQAILPELAAPHAPPSSYKNAVSGDDASYDDTALCDGVVGSAGEAAGCPKDVRSQWAVHADDPLVDCYHDRVLCFFEDLKHVMQMRGLMANSRPEGLVRAIHNSTTFEPAGSGARDGGLDGDGADDPAAGHGRGGGVSLLVTDGCAF